MIYNKKNKIILKSAHISLYTILYIKIVKIFILELKL